ncbi:hypothetical protein [Acinetobacter sp. IK40]|jgi:hypothetical protein|uniref:hypothetical protein n=1 Tax=Acinetobacter sp. IK40 TaxID=2928897 RepID=UPI002D1F73F9|nr:hypothetical protein [Acinetobacter sp. IK40]MEB3791510.1 hypothetical protein [Acinetobacter sp. IK40]
MTISPVQIYREFLLSLRDRDDSHDKFVGWLALDFDSIMKLKGLADIELANSSLGVKKAGSENSTNVDIDRIIQSYEDRFSEDGILFRIELEKTNNNRGDSFLICSDWNELLSFEHYVEFPVAEILFTKTNIYYNIDSKDPKYKNYLKVGKVYKFIQYLSEQTKSDQGTIFFNRSYKFRFKLTENCLESSIDSESLELLMKKDMHREAIIHLMSKEVTNFIKDQDENNRFIYIIQNLNPLIHNINHSYQSYVDNYSFDKVRKEYLEKRTEYIKKMNEAFDSVATKMLAIPAGIWFAMAQIQEVDPVKNLSATKNLVVLITIALMVLLLIINILGQRNTLNSMIKEYTSVFLNLSSKFEDESPTILSVKEELDSTAVSVKLKMYFSIFSAITLFLITFFLFMQSNYSFSFNKIINFL